MPPETMPIAATDIISTNLIIKIWTEIEKRLNFERWGGVSFANWKLFSWFWEIWVVWIWVETDV